MKQQNTLELNKTGNERFSSAGFILSAIGSSVGLGNMWKFPYITGLYGGAAFFLLFIIFLVLCGLPILLAELTIGRGGRGNAASSFEVLSGKKSWAFFGFLSVLAAFIIMAFYTVVAGWTLHYAVQSFTGSLFENKDYAAQFTDFNAGFLPVVWQVVVMILSVWVVARGISGGIEKFNKVLIPGLVVLLIMLMIRALTLPGGGAGVEFFLSPDFSKLTFESALVALGHAFFSLSLGMGIMITYGAYVNREQSLGTASMAVGFGDLIYALIAGLIIFPTSFAFGIPSSSGPGLVFIALPAAFEAMPFGHFFGGLFFILLAVAALTSAVSILEVPVAYVMNKMKWSRAKSAIALGILLLIVGIPAAMSVTGPLSTFLPGGKSLFDWMDFLGSYVLVPIGGLVVTLFTGFAWKRAGEEAGLTSNWYKLWMFLLRWVAPIMMVAVFIYSVYTNLG
ncbi:sodium-dependent transporter [Paenibacillus gansuensis]|uniref:Transporter n=1 Tax=Paenibacillus gansuensis TaxID=306542 RepID=A0ABW5PLY1_9BACL